MPTRSLLLALVAPLALFAASSASSELIFEPNRGQTAPSVRYAARASAGAVFFTDREVVLRQSGSDSAIAFELAGARPDAPWEEQERGPATTSYILGREAAGWIRDIPQYRRLLRRGVYPGIDAAWYGNAGRLEYDFLLGPHADPRRIRIRVTGASRVAVTASGGLDIHTAAGTLHQAPPEIYQTLADGRRSPVAGRFRLTGAREVAFDVGAYDPALPLCIDPVIESSVYLGGSGADGLIAATSPTRYVGMTSSVDFPGAALARRGGRDIVVHTGVSVWVIGGSGDEEVTAAYMQSSGDIAVVGYTNSKDLPVNVTAIRNVAASVWQPEFGGGATDGFFFWISQSPNSFTPANLYLSYIGTPGNDRLNAVTFGFQYSGYTLVGETDSPGLPDLAGFRPLQPGHAGGMDGFVMVVGGFNQSPAIYFSTYFGGAGDDRPLAVTVSGSNLYLAGQTSSHDLPIGSPISTKRDGPTDAFLVRIQARFPELILAGGTLLGGNGVDRGAVLAWQGANLTLAGVTSSTDLPVAAAIQGSYGGGESDIFLARFLPDLSQMLSLTYYGGSGAEEPAAAMQEQGGTLYVGGWTSSADFPVRDAVQPSYGGGPDDAFLLHFISEDRLYHATFYGGTGSDRAAGVFAVGDSSVYLSGRTTSSDLPLNGAAGGVLSGASDGFLARVSSPLLWPFRAIGAKGFRGSSSISVGRLNGSSDATITVTSGDPASVLLAASSTGPAQASIQLPGSTTGSNPAYRGYQIECQVENGGADLTISAEGYETRVIRADCFPAQARPSYSYPLTPDSQGRLSISQWSPSTRITLNLAAVNPARTTESATIYPLSYPFTVQIVSSDPRTVEADPSAVFTSTTSQASFSMKPSRAGDARLTFTAPGSSLNGSIDISVTQPLSLTEFTLPAGFQMSIGGYSGAAPENTVATVTSEDPSRLVFSTDANQAGSAVLETKLGGLIYAQGLQPGDVTIRLAVPGFDPVSSVVHVVPATLYCSGCARTTTIGLDEAASFSFWIGGPQDTTSRYLGPNPGAPVRITLEMSTPGIATPDRTVVDFKETAYGAGSFRLTGAAAGSTTLTFAAGPSVAIGPSASPIELRVRRYPLQMADVDAGKDLAAQVTLSSRSAFTGDITVTIADPALGVLSIDNRAAGQRQITLPGGRGFSTARFYVQGLAASGRTTITAEAPGYDPVTATVTLNPSGFGWSAAFLTSVQYSAPFAAGILAYAIDSASMLPVASHTLRFGVTAAPRITNSDPAVVSFTAMPEMKPNELYSPSVTPKGPGDATLAIEQPAGFVAPSIRQTLPIHIDKPVLRLFGSTIGKDTLASINIQLPSNGPETLAVSSSDPSRLLLSASRSEPGAATATVRNTGSFTQFFAHGIDASGSVAITATMPGFIDATATYRLAPVGVGISPVYGSSGAPLATTTKSGPTPLRLGLYVLDEATRQILPGVSFGEFRPGIEPPVVAVVSSNPEVGRIEGSPVRVSPSSSSEQGLTFAPLATGSADASVVQPAGYVAPAGYDRVSFRVTGPGFQNTSVTMARDTVTAQRVSLGNGVLPPTANVEVTITSPDPARVLLSSTPEGAPSASVTKVVVAGRYNTDDFYVHALDSAGTVPLAVSSPGYDSATLTVTLRDLAFYFADLGSDPVRAIIQSGPRRLTVGFRPAGVNDFRQTPIRPGVSPIVLNITTSDAATLALPSPQITFAPGAVSATFDVTPLVPGPAVLSLEAPAPYTVERGRGFLPVNVEGAKLSLGSYGATMVGKDLQVQTSVSSEVAIKTGTVITITSSDPSRLLLSPDRNTPGQPSIVTTMQNYPGPAVWIQALSDNGTVAVTASADGYQSATAQFNLVPSAATMQDSFGTTLYTNSGPVTHYVYLSALDPATLRPVTQQQLRAGAGLAVTVSSSNPSVLTTSISSLSLANDDQSRTFTVRPVGIGTAVISVGPLPGGATPSSGGQIAYTVAEPDLSIPEVTVGRDLQVPVQARLAARLPVPATDLILRVESQEFNVAVGDGRTVVRYWNPITVRIPAGQRVSAPFYIVGVAPGTGRVAVSAPGGSYNSSSSTMTVVGSTFVIKEATPINLSLGGAGTLTVVPALLPLGTPSPEGLSVAVSVVGGLSIATPSMLTATPATATFQPGDSQAAVTLRGLATGSTTVSLSPFALYQIPNARSTVEVRVAQ